MAKKSLTRNAGKNSAGKRRTVVKKEAPKKGMANLDAPAALKQSSAQIAVNDFARESGELYRFLFEASLNTTFVEIEARARDENTDDTIQPVKYIQSLQEARSTSLIYLADNDPVLTNTLASQVMHFGYCVQTFARLEDLRAALRRDIPAAVLMDIMFLEDEAAGSEIAQTLQAEYNNLLPIFFLSARDDVPARLQAIRVGGRNYFVKPVDISALVDALDKVITDEEPEPYRVLIVDDSEVQAKVNAAYLKKVGIVSRMITNPLDVLRALEEFSPDLLLLDLYMPECNGLELAQVIRQMKAFVSLPIVYLSAETDREKQLAAIGFGGDDFLTKPIKPDHLISAVISRIERYRQLRALMLRDSLTGLFNHTSILERLEREVAHSIRNHQPLAFAMLDMDYFKKVNDTYGHAAGDRALKALTHILTRRLRRSDIIGRYGGDEFVVILPNTDEATALQMFDELREAFSLVRHVNGGIEFSVTLSCGVAVFPKQQTPADLSEAADRALYVAKRQGRNQVALAE